MRRRIYWLLPDMASAMRALDNLLLARVGERHIRFVGHDGADMADLPSANVLQTSDVVRAAQADTTLGAAVGGVAGALAAAQFVIAGSPSQWVLIGLLAIVGALFGAWTAAVIGLAVPSRRLQCFQPAIASGLILLMVDVPRSRIEAVKDCLLAAQEWFCESAAGRPALARTGHAGPEGAEAIRAVGFPGEQASAAGRARRLERQQSSNSTIRRIRYGLLS